MMIADQSAARGAARPTDGRYDPITWDAPSHRGRAISEPWDMLIHDLRNPLAVVHGYTELLRRRAVGQGSQIAGLDEGLRHIQDAAARLDRLVDQLAKASAPTGTQCAILPPSETDLVQLAQRMAADSQPMQAGPRRVAVVPSDTELVGCWDPTFLERVLGNLLDNALKYSPTDRPVVVTLQREGGWAVIGVADQGLGIPPADLPKVFDHGYRAPNAAGSAPGGGIGLAAVRHIVDALGGTISIHSQVGLGTTMIVRLPLRRPKQTSARVRSPRRCSGS